MTKGLRNIRSLISNRNDEAVVGKGRSITLTRTVI